MAEIALDTLIVTTNHCRQIFKHNHNFSTFNHGDTLKFFIKSEVRIEFLHHLRKDWFVQCEEGPQPTTSHLANVSIPALMKSKSTIRADNDRNRSCSDGEISRR